MTVADGAQVGSGRVGCDGVPGGEDGGEDGGGVGGGGVESLVGLRDVGCFWRQSGHPGFGRGQQGRWCLSPGEYETGQSDPADVGLDRVDGEGGGGGWTWGVVQRESRGRPGELEWVQLQRVGQPGSSQDDSPDHYWQPNLA